MNKFAQIKLRWQEEGGDIAPGANEPKPLTEEELDNIEQALQCRLPKGYREFLEIFGVEYSSLYLEFPYQKEGRTSSGQISMFYGFFRDKTVPIYEWTRDLIAFNSNLSPEKAPQTICIGDDPGGYQICLCVHGEHFGSVYFWDRDKAWSAESVDDLYFVASSFEEFISKLRVVH